MELKEDSNNEEEDDGIDWLALPVKKVSPKKSPEKSPERSPVRMDPPKRESPRKTFGNKINSIDEEPVGKHRNVFNVPE